MKETHYHPLTDPKVRQIIEKELQKDHNDRRRLVFYYGDRETGRAWGDAQVGRIGRSAGREPIPLAVHNNRSRGGPGLLDHCIIRIDEARGKKTIYLHPNASVLKPVNCPRCRHSSQIELTCKACGARVR